MLVCDTDVAEVAEAALAETPWEKMFALASEHHRKAPRAPRRTAAAAPGAARRAGAPSAALPTVGEQDHPHPDPRATGPGGTVTAQDKLSVTHRFQLELRAATVAPAASDALVSGGGGAREAEGTRCLVDTLRVRAWLPTLRFVTSAEQLSRLSAVLPQQGDGGQMPRHHGAEEAPRGGSWAP